MSAHKKLMQARIELQGRKLSKSGHNKFAGYKYFELGDFLPTIQQIFSELGLIGVVSYSNEIAELRITNIDEPRDYIVITSPMSTAALKGCHEVQNLGAVQTYIRRYLWVTALEIVEHDALDSTSGQENEDVAWAEEVAMPVRSMFARGDIAGAAYALNTLGTNGEYDAEAKEAVWSRLGSNIRSTIKAYEAIARAESLSALKVTWESTPKHALKVLEPFKDKRKEELTQPEKEAA